MNEFEVAKSLGEYLFAPANKNIGLQVFLGGPEIPDSSKLANWSELDQEGEININKIPAFIKKERGRLRREYRRSLRNSEVSHEYLNILEENISILKGWRSVTSAKGKETAQRFFLRELAVAEYLSRNDISLVMAAQPIGEDNLNWVVITSCRKVLKVL